MATPSNRSPVRPGQRPCFPPAIVHLFGELTGLPLRWVPAPPPGLEWDPAAVAVACCDGRRGQVPARCVHCLRASIRLALGARRTGRAFRGLCRARMFLLPVDGGPRPVALVALRMPVRPPQRMDRTGVVRARAARTDDDLRFRRAARLLRRLAKDASVRERAARLAAQTNRLRDALAARESEVRRLRAMLGRSVPAGDGGDTRWVAKPVGHPAVRRILDWVHRNYVRRLTLTEIARELGMNASYLSFLFSRETGMPFRPYVATLRLQRAQELLRAGHARITDVADAVGYASPDRFRAAFRQWSGLAPARWRRTFGTS